MSKAINASVNLNTNHTATANTNTNHTANANTNQHRRDTADETEVEASTIIDLEFENDQYDYEPRLHTFGFRGCRCSSKISSSPSLTPFSNGLFDLPPFFTNALPQAQQRPPVASPQLNGFPRLILPSDIQAQGELAANVFVDIEADVCGGAGGSGGASGDEGGVGHGNGTLNSNYPQEPNASQSHEDPDEFHYPFDDHQEQEFEFEWLNYSESLQPTSRTTAAPYFTENSNSNRRKIDWAKTEKNWDTSVPLTRVEHVGEAGCWVAWKAPTINPGSLTPEILFSVAQISPASSTNNMNRISYRVMQRPETSDAAQAFGIGRRSRSGASAGGSGFGGSGLGSGSGFGGAAGTGLDETRQDDGEHPEEDLLGDEEIIALKEAVEAGWRVLVV